MDDGELIGLLFSAIHHHNVSLLDDLLRAEKAADLIDVPAEDGQTLLHVAVRENDLNCLVCLLKHGANPNVFDASRARSPLHLAVELGQEDAVKTFLNLQHVDLELRDDRNLTCYEIAQFCDNQQLAELILGQKEEFERFKDDFYTVMNQACTSNEPRLVRELFERSERKIINNLPPGWQPYRDKRQYSRSELRKLINWSSSSWNDVTLLFKSASKGHTEVCRLLIEFGATAKCNESTNYSPLYVAAYGGHTNTVKLLLDSFPALVQEVTIEKWTVLHACCLQGHAETAKLLLNYAYPEQLKRRFVSRSGLYEYNFAFNLNAQDAAGQTVIYLAVSANNETLLDTLLAFNIEAKLIERAQASTPTKATGGGGQTATEQQTQHARMIPDRPRQRANNVAEADRTSRFYPNQIDKIMRQLRKLQFSRDSENAAGDNEIGLSGVRDDKRRSSRDNPGAAAAAAAPVDDDIYLICPFEMDTYCDYNSKTALHLAVCQQYHGIATTLLVNGSNPNLPILFRDSALGNKTTPPPETSASTSAASAGLGAFAASGVNGGASGGTSGDIGLNWLRSSKSTCLKEACRLNDERMCEILIRYGARDNQDNLALQVAAANKNHNLISMFLALKSNVDPEFKINRKFNVEFAARYKQSQRLANNSSQLSGGGGGGGGGTSTTTFSSMFPSAPVTIDWQNLKCCLQQLDPQWLIEASLAHNKRLRHPTNSLMAITRLDLSANNLKSVHPVIFRLPSLRELNLASNRLESLLVAGAATASAGSQRQQRKSVLALARADRELAPGNTPTSKLIESQRTAMRRSKSSSFANSNSASLESSNAIDLNEPQEWDLPHLETLDLHDNLLIALPDCLFTLPKLAELDVSSNQLRQLPWAMWTAPSLRELVVSANLLDDLPREPPASQLPAPPPPSRPSTASSLLEQQVETQSGDQSNLSAASFDQSLDGSKVDAQNGASFLSSVDSAESSSTTAATAREVNYLARLQLDGGKQLGETTLTATRRHFEHLNHWSKRIELITEEENLRARNSIAHNQAAAGAAGEPSGGPVSKLTHLNLSQNCFARVPPMLACLATELTRLNMSFNHLHSLGDLSLFPYKLKSLDVSSNQLTNWFQSDENNENDGHDDNDDNATKRCYANHLADRKLSLGAGSSAGNAQNQLVCVHKLHQRLDNLRSLNLSHNQLKEIQLYSSQPTLQAQLRSSHNQRGSRRNGEPHRFRHALFHPNLTALDLSFNCLTRVPECVSELRDLSALNLSGNTALSSLPPELGLATKLWNLGVNGCSLSEPLKSIVESKTYKTMDIIGYLRSILEESKPYARMKLMLVGLQGIGKTSLLEQMRLEGQSGFRRRVPEHWTKRMGHTSRSNLKNQKGVTLSTVGVDIHDWVYQKKQATRNQHTFGPVSFSTWDFGGQEEFYATHRYFLSRRSIYLVVWRLTDGLEGIRGIQQWLVNIQSRAPNSPVIIVATHEDLIEGGERSDLVQQLQAEVHKRFIDLSDHDKCGLPRIMDSIVVSTRTKLNVRHLCNRIYDVVFSLRCPGSTERLLEQKIPATYLYLEEIVSSVAHERHQKRREPVLGYDEYKRLVTEQMKLKHNKTFRDLEPLGSREINYNSELHQATRFLHENGVLLHYEDANLRDLYFLDPQWLCDILSHVVTIREINPHVKNGLMNIDDLSHLFKSLDVNLSGAGGVQSYVVNLLNKFEVALTWNSQYLLIPSLLPDRPDSLLANLEHRSDQVQVKLAPRLRGRSVARRAHADPLQRSRASSIDPINWKNAKQQQRQRQSEAGANVSTLKNRYEFECRPEEALSRLVLLRYLPAGFLARLQSAILSEPAFEDACEDLHLELSRAVALEGGGRQLGEEAALELANLLGQRPGWWCWKRGVRLSLQRESTINTRAGGQEERGGELTLDLMTIQELDSSSRELLVNRLDLKIECTRVPDDEPSERAALAAAARAAASSQWVDLDLGQYSNILAITLPNARLKVTPRSAPSAPSYFALDRLLVARLLARAVDHIDDLLEDWYPSLGARFAHTLGGNYLVTRVVPCQQCAAASRLFQQALGLSTTSAIQGRPSRASRTLHETRQGIKFSMSGAGTDAQMASEAVAEATVSVQDNQMFCYYVEHCILNAYDLAPAAVAPTTRFSLGGGGSGGQSPAKRPAAKARNLQCPRHGLVQVAGLAPDIVFDDLPERLKIDNEQIERCKLIGRGALGFVFRGTLHSAFPLNQLGQANQEVALKLLQPVEPGAEAEAADVAAYKSARANWSREPFQSACKSYCSARHEVNILQAISHPNIVAFNGLCLRPLAIVLELAPLGSLADVFRNYKRACARIDQFAAQKCVLQVAKALEFLHQQRVIYRDLKSENILVWSFPSPFAAAAAAAATAANSSSHLQPNAAGAVELKLADYGISRQALATGIWKGFAGTMSYLAPEILRHNGDEEYTEKVDCFSFGVFLFELLTLRPPYKQNEAAAAAAAAPGPTPAALINKQVAAGAGEGAHRPALQQRDLAYPNYMLDLMSLCWSQEPHDRPTASQIVSIASAPEFMQIHDAVQLDASVGQPSFAGAFQCGASLNLWFGEAKSGGCHLNMLATSARNSGNGGANAHQWLRCEQIELKEAAAQQVTSVCLVGQDLWFCESRGPNVHVTSARLRATPARDQTRGADGEPAEPAGLRASSFVLRDRHGKLARVGQIKTMLYAERAKCVLFLTCDGRLWACKLATMICEQLEDSAIAYNCVALPAERDAATDLLPSSPSSRSPCAAAGDDKNAAAADDDDDDDSDKTGSLDTEAGASFQLFCGQANGISLLEISADGEVRRQSILPLAGSGTPSARQGEVDDSLLGSPDGGGGGGVEISHILAPSADLQGGELLWTAANCTVHLWSVRGKHVIRKLDCWKLVPCSESLESINIELYYQEAKSSCVSSLALLREQLFVGTSHGCLMVIEASTLKPMTVFRPFESQVTVLRPVAAAAERSGEGERARQAEHLVALGCGYRDLMRRYLASGLEPAEEQAAGERHKLAAVLLTAASQCNL